MTNESHIFTQMPTFSRIWHISLKYQMNVIFYSNDHIFTHLAYFTQPFCYFSSRSWFFEIVDIFMVVIAQVRSFIGRWYS
jgi:hypothetical protein